MDDYITHYLRSMKREHTIGGQACGYVLVFGGSGIVACGTWCPTYAKAKLLGDDRVANNEAFFMERPESLSSVLDRYKEQLSKPEKP